MPCKQHQKISCSLISNSLVCVLWNNDPRINFTSSDNTRHPWTSILLVGWIRVEPWCSVDRLLHTPQYPVPNVASSISCVIRGKSLKAFSDRDANRKQRALADQAQKIAKSYNSPQYQSAADNLRIPYWDWAETPNLPDVVTTPNISITVPSGPIIVKNPLYEYKFLNFPLNETLFPGDKDARLSTYPVTVRQPNSDGVSQNGEVSSELSGRPLRKNTVSWTLLHSPNALAADVLRATVRCLC
jgi:hypothetical protein